MDICKISVSVPKEYAAVLMDAIDEAAEWVTPTYSRAFTITDSTGTWIPLEGSDPCIGEQDTISYAEEQKLEFVIKTESLKKVLKAIERTHPYEEPAVDVIPCRYWRDYLE